MFLSYKHIWGGSPRLVCRWICVYFVILIGIYIPRAKAAAPASAIVSQRGQWEREMSLKGTNWMLQYHFYSHPIGQNLVICHA